MHGIVAYIFLTVREKIHQFLSGVNKIHTKRKLIPFLPHCVVAVNAISQIFASTINVHYRCVG